MEYLNDAITDATQAMCEELDYELRAAWRMDYDYVHIYGDAPGNGAFDPREKITVRTYILATNQKQPPRPKSREYRYTYDLTAVSDEAVREAIR